MQRLPFRPTVNNGQIIKIQTFKARDNLMSLQCQSINLNQYNWFIKTSSLYPKWFLQFQYLFPTSKYLIWMLQMISDRSHAREEPHNVLSDNTFNFRHDPLSEVRRSIRIFWPATVANDKVFKLRTLSSDFLFKTFFSRN